MRLRGRHQPDLRVVEAAGAQVRLHLPRDHGRHAGDRPGSGRSPLHFQLSDGGAFDRRREQNSRLAGGEGREGFAAPQAEPFRGRNVISLATTPVLTRYPATFGRFRHFSRYRGLLALERAWSRLPPGFLRKVAG